MTCDSQPRASQPRLSTLLLAFGASAQGAMLSRCSIFANHGAMSSTPCPATSCCAAQCCSVGAGVRKLEVQLTVVVPPTARPCSIAMAPSELARPADSWYRSEYARASSMSLKLSEVFSGPSSSSSTLRPASARISAATPPPAPLPMIATSASSVCGALSVEASMIFQPDAMPAA